MSVDEPRFYAKPVKSVTSGTSYSDVWEVKNGYSYVESQFSTVAPVPTTSSPTLDVTVETSLDGTNYSTLLTHTQVTTSAVTSERKQAIRTASVPVGTFLRIKYVVANGDTPVYATTTALMACQ